MKILTHARDARRRSAAFTLLEVLLAMALLLFGMTAVLGLLTFGSALSRTAQLRTSAAMAVESVVADLEETLFPIVHGEAAEPVAIENRELGGAEGIVYSAVARANPDRPLEYKVEVEMRWKSGGVQREKRFTTLLLREISFGERLRRRFVQNDTKAFEPAPAEPTAPADGAASQDATTPRAPNAPADGDPSTPR